MPVFGVNLWGYQRIFKKIGMYWTTSHLFCCLSYLMCFQNPQTSLRSLFTYDTSRDRYRHTQKLQSLEIPFEILFFCVELSFAHNLDLKESFSWYLDSQRLLKTLSLAASCVKCRKINLFTSQTLESQIV